MMLTMVTRFECDDAMANAIIKLNEKGYGTRFNRIYVLQSSS